MGNDVELLRSQVLSIVNTLENPELLEENEDGEPSTAIDYICDALDIEYIVSSKKEFLGARILVCFGGPNVWINTKTDTVEGYWWGDECSMPYTDELGLHDAAEELFNC